MGHSTRPDLMRPALLVLLGALAFAACDSDDDRVAAAGDAVAVSYVGTLEDGTVFDQSPRATFSLQRVIPGFRDGIVGMRVGEQKTIVIPPEQAYGEAGVVRNGVVVIPPNATLTFDVELLAIL